MLNVQFLKKRAYAQMVILALLLLHSTLAFAQNRVSGLVTDKTGEPLIGVNVVEKGTANGVITDFEGNFTLDVEQGKILVFSYVGYTTKEVKVTNNNLRIIMEDDSKILDEVVVVGYGSMSRKDVTSSITTVKSDQLNVGVYTDPAQMLQGKVPGLNIVQSSDPTAGTSSITLRGSSTLRTDAGASEPYYVIDGIPGMSLSLVAPDDIESIDVLRDASATAIYGSKAANGVIVVTTKKGKKGDRASVTYSAYIAADNVLKNLDMMTGDELRDYAARNNVSLPNDLGYNTDWQKEVLRTAFSHNHNVSISGGSDKTQYSASLAYMNKEGIIRGTSNERFSGRAFVQTKALNDRLTLAFNINAAQNKSTYVRTEAEGASVLDAMNYYSPLVPVRNEDGTWYDGTNQTQNFNPVSMINEDLSDKTSKLLQGTAKASLEILNGLVWNLNLSYQNEQILRNEYHSTLSQVIKNNGQAYRSSIENKKKVLETYVNFDRTFADVHKLGLMAGYSWEQSDDNDRFGLTVYDFYNDVLGYYNLGYANKMDMSGIEPNSGTGSLSTLRMISFYGRANYSFASKYLLQATVRRDGSSAFGVNNRWGTFPSVSAAWRMSEEKFIKDMNVFDDLKFRVGYGVSGNSLGFDAFTAIQRYGASGWFSYTDPAGNVNDYRTLAAISNANPDLKWERTSMLNIGLDFSFFGGRLGGTVEWYDKKTSDLIYGYSVSTTRYPYGTMIANVGDISNKGIEITINAIPVQTDHFTWSTSLNLSHNKNKVVSMSNDQYSAPYFDWGNPNIRGNSTANVQRVMQGSSLGTFYMWEWVGIDPATGTSLFNEYDYILDGNGNQVTDENGQPLKQLVGTTTSPEDKDRVKTGCALPKLNIGWSNTFNYRNWSLTAFFTGQFGNKIFNATAAQYSNVGNVTEGKNILASLADSQEYPYTDKSAHAPSNRYLENGSYFRLSTLTLGYTFGKMGNWINSLKVYGTCNNVFTLTGYSGRDPEINLGGLEPGMDTRRNYYPRTRSFIFGINVNF